MNHNKLCSLQTEYLASQSRVVQDPLWKMQCTTPLQKNKIARPIQPEMTYTRYYHNADVMASVRWQGRRSRRGTSTTHIIVSVRRKARF